MKIWNVNVSYTELENDDLGTYGTKEKAMEAAASEMKLDPGWKRSYFTDNEIHYSNGEWVLVVESLYVA